MKKAKKTKRKTQNSPKKKLAFDEDAKWRFREVYRILLMADKERLRVLEEEDKRIKLND